MFEFITGKKRCCTCKEPKDLSEFGRNKREKDGKERRCKECNRLRQAKRVESKIENNLCKYSGCKEVSAVNNFCVKHLIKHRISSASRPGARKSRVCLITEQMANQYLSQWFNQGGQLDGTGATCWRTNKPISFLDGSATIGHRLSVSNFNNGCDFNHPSNVAFEHAQSNYEIMGKGTNKMAKRFWTNLGCSAQLAITGNSKNGAQLGQQLEAIYNSRPSWKCPYYGTELTPETMSLDHIIPASKGGTNSLDNLQFVSRRANNAKGGMTHKEFCEKYNIKATTNPLHLYQNYGTT